MDFGHHHQEYKERYHELVEPLVEVRGNQWAWRWEQDRVFLLSRVRVHGMERKLDWDSEPSRGKEKEMGRAWKLEELMD